MKRILKFISFILVLFLLVSCDKNNPQEEAKTVDPAEEKMVQNMFINKGTKASDNYYFEKVADLRDDSKLTRKFLYNIKDNNYKVTFYQESISIPRGGIPYYNYASITFNLGNLKNGIYYAYHKLEGVAMIEFDYYDIKYDEGGICDFKYTVRSNTYDDLDESVSAYSNLENLVYCVQYMQEVFKDNKVSINLW